MPTHRALSRGVIGAFIRWTAVAGDHAEPFVQQRLKEAFDGRGDLDGIDRLEVLCAATLRLGVCNPHVAAQAKSEALLASAGLPPPTVAFVEELFGGSC